ncbi:valine--tRNA ligase [Candidatus Woesearchaeota archaeon]|nr:valine--tRNA ligase [Candidatus Woesearchaeota archaeon]
MELQKWYDIAAEEAKWQAFWEEKKIFRFDPDGTGEVFAVDTPPPTVSGKMHLGHAFSYAQQDFVVRYRRMRGMHVYFPFGTDDNGLPTLRLIEKTKGVKAEKMGRERFRKLCVETLENDLRPGYIKDWKRIAMSCDFDSFYTTINNHCRRISQKSFIDLYKAGREYRKEAPAMYCTECRTAISQVELQDAELDSFFNDIVFELEDGSDLIIATTRPELLPACVAIFAHPEDERYAKLFGKRAKVPLFDFWVPIMPSPRADPEKGTGILMCCTFGDQDDVEHYLEHKLPLKVAIDGEGNMTDLAGSYKGMSVSIARRMIIEDLKGRRKLLSQTPIRHTVNVHERCGTEVQILNSKQWFIRYLDLKEQMLAWGRELNWYPNHMRVRYENWVNGLRWDWCISRQIYFGIPFPVWYCAKCEAVILAREEDLPVDPITDRPPVTKCPKCGHGEFVPETDIINTWATSSLTPQIAADLYKGHPIHQRLYPMSMRPQAHDIITFWLFNTVVKSRLHNGVNPWKDCVISGHALDPRGKKMSKSKGNVVEPQKVMDEYGADCLRFWAASSKLGEDLPFMEKDLVTGRKFITKLWNASRFALMHLGGYAGARPKRLAPIDAWLLSRLHRLIKGATESFERYEYARTRLETEKFFWQVFCDNYLEFVKERLYNSEAFGPDEVLSAKYTLYQANLAIIKLMAPIMPHITEAVFQLYYAKHENEKSIHLSQWPAYDAKLVDEKAEKAGDLAVVIVGAVRRHKSENALSLKTELAMITVECTKQEEALLSGIEKDLLGVTKARRIAFGKADQDIPDTALRISIEQ